MSPAPDAQVRPAGPEDAVDVARLLHDFNAEFDEPTPAVEVLAERVRELVARGEIVVLLAGEGLDGLAQFRFLRSVWSDGLDVYLEELYVVPERRGKGIGRALLEATMRTGREGGATRIDLNTAETDTAARSLYESAGFSNREGSEDGPSMLYYERDL
ncbi:MAG: GNAT family N-acetyltransferase [Solirubrobacterales bacterium]